MTEGIHKATAEDEAPCSAFEATLGLLDGTLDAKAAEKAAAHAKACLVCRPLVAHWPAASDAFVARFEDAAERAKPDLAGLADRVLAKTAKPVEKPSTAGRFFAFLRGLQAPVALVAAAAAIAFVVLPMTKDGAGPLPAPASEPGTPTAQATPPEPNDCHVHKLAFDAADGMVFRTPTDHMTVIWVNEHDNA